jgi:hypothetical protein
MHYFLQSLDEWKFKIHLFVNNWYQIAWNRLHLKTAFYVMFYSKGLKNSNLLFRSIQIKVQRLNHNWVSLLLLTNSSQTWFICLSFLLCEFICWGNKSQELFNYLSRSLLCYCWQKTIPLLFNNKFFRMKSSAYYNLN